MRREMMRSKIHRARITGSDLDYEGSVTVGPELLDAADIAEYERVQIVNVDNGERLETYTIKGDEGELCLNGAAARLGEVGDTVILISYGLFDQDESPDTTVVHVDDENEVVEVD